MIVNLGYLKKLRKEKGISLQEMANAVGLTTAGGYKRIEDGENRLTADRLPLIAKRLGVNPNELYNEIFFAGELDERSSLKGGDDGERTARNSDSSAHC